MFKISKSSIKTLAMDEASYFAGLRYYNRGMVSNVTWSKVTQKYRALVKSSNTCSVSISCNESAILSCECSCGVQLTKKGACKHIIAVLFFIEHYVENSIEKEEKTEEEKKVSQIIDYFSRRELRNSYNEVFRLKLKVVLPSLFKNHLQKAFVSFYAGSSKWYKVQNVKKFLSEMYKKENISLGKEFHFVSGESKFTKDSQMILDYFLEIFEIQEVLGKVAYSNLFSKGEMTFSKNMLLKLLKIVGNDSFQLELYDRESAQVHGMLGNPVIKFDLDVDNNIIKMDFHDKKTVIPMAEDGSMLLFDDVVYLPDEEFICNYAPFYKMLGNEKNSLLFQGEQKDQFLKIVLPKIYETMEVETTEALQDKFVKEKVQINVYLDYYKTFIKASVFFQYGIYDINGITSKVPNDVIIIRDRKIENDFLDSLEKKHFFPYKDSFILKKDENIYEFLTNGIYQLKEMCNLFYSDDFKKGFVSSPGVVKSHVQVAREGSLLDLEMSFENVPSKELKEFFHSLQIKKKYHRLKNGNFISLESKEIVQSSQLLSMLHLSENDIEGGSIKVPSYEAVYLDTLMEEMNVGEYQKGKEYQSLLDGILKPKDKEYDLPDSITASLRSYQVTGYKWLRTLADHLLGGILADDMGLGKTLQAITYMDAYKERGKILYLVVCPTSLLYNWQEECERFAPKLSALIISGTPDERERAIKRAKENDVVITSYPLLRRDIIFYEGISFHTLFIDEAQFIKNANSMNARIVKKIKADRRFALTGTPIENSLSELWSIFDFVLPGYLMSHKNFMERYEKPIVKDENKEVLEDLGKHIHPFILRRMKKEVLTELPEKIETKLLTELTEQQKLVYFSYLNEIRSQILEEGENVNQAQKQIQILKGLTRLRQICCHPSTFIQNYKGGSGKLDVLMELTGNILDNGHRILIFSQFTSMLQLIEKEFTKYGISYFYLDGSTKAEMRKDYVKRFNEGECSAFLISLKAGGTGLNLTGADTVIHFDPWWNPAVEEQAADRAYRMGQQNSVQVIKLITKDTIEEKIYQLQKRKKELSDSVIQSKEIFINKLTREELKEILS